MESLFHLKFHKHYGQSLVELLVAMGLAAILLPALLTGIVTSREGRPQIESRNVASQLLREATESLRVIRRSGWAAVSTNGSYHPEISDSTWVLVPGTQTLNGFTRSIDISEVYRDSAGQIVISGGILDPSTKKAAITISWTLPYTSSMTSEYYLTRYMDNLAYIQTTVADFSTGILNNTLITDSAGGEIQLSPNNRAKWCTPEFSLNSIDLPDGPPVAVTARASTISNANPNDVLVATAPDTTSSIKMAYIDVTANSDPPVSSLHGIFTLDSTKYSSAGLVPVGIGLDNSFKTNDIKYYTSSSGKLYALIATDKPDREVVVVAIDDTNFQDTTNKIYKYWTYFNTQIFNPNSDLDTGFLNPSANLADSGGDGDGYGTNPTRGYSNNSSFAVDSNSGSGSGTSCTGADKDKHRYYNYNFSLPSGATVNGIEVRLDARADSASGSPQMCVQLSWDGGTTWTTPKSTAALTTSEATYLLGGATDTWGQTWTDTNFTNANFRARIINVSSNTSRDFSLDWLGVKLYYSGGVSSSNDQAPFGYGAKSISVLGDIAYVASGGYLYSFNLSNIDSKTTTNGLDMIGCRIQLDGYDCSPGTNIDRKYAAGETNASWSDTTTPAHSDCSDGGNIELYADNHIQGVQVGSNNYVFVAIGAGTNPEFEIVNATSVPDSVSSPSISNASCGRISGGNSGWKVVGTLDFNSLSGTEEAANSVYAKSDGSRAYISSNGGIDANHDGQPDSKQFYVINTSTKTSPQFLSGTSSTGATSGFFYGTGANADLFPRRSLTVLNGDRVVLVGQDGFINANDAYEYQVLNSSTESTPTYCGGLNFDQGFNDLTAVSEADGDNFVYMVANTTLNELKIIQGGPDGTYLDNGVYESPVFSVGYPTAFNRLSATVNTPTNTNVNFQVAIADPADGNCETASYIYVGPDGTDSTYFAYTGDKIPANNDGSGYENPGRCFKYKAFLTTTDYNQTPTLNDVIVNYSP